MPKETFYNLPEDKRIKILHVLKKEFKEKPFKDVQVKSIVEELDIARGSFYQYFENLEDSYFTILDQETTDIHQLFLYLLGEYKDLFTTLEHYGESIAQIIFDENYMIYKHRFLNWTQDLDRGWKSFQEGGAKEEEMKERLLRISSQDFSEEMHFVKATIHSLIQRIFLEPWSKEEFLTHYKQHLAWIKKGVSPYVLD